MEMQKQKNNIGITAVKDAIQMIDREMGKPLDLDFISKEVGISKYHLHRLFKSITNKSLMSYVRERRLSLSITDLLCTEQNILDIALKYQFDYEQSYIRAFRKRFNTTPAEYRKKQIELQIEQMIDTNHLHIMGKGIMIEPRMCIRPSFYVQGNMQHVLHEQNMQQRVTVEQGELFNAYYLPNMDGVVDKNILIGLVIYREHSANDCYYVTCVEVKGKQEVLPPLINYQIPYNEYAVFRYIGLHSVEQLSIVDLQTLYMYINRWKSEAVYKQYNTYHFESINLKVCSEVYCEVDIYIPISIK